MRTMSAILMCAMALAVVGATPASGQEQDVLQPIDQRVEDVGVLSRSLRKVEPGLQMPTDFRQVYRVPGQPDHFMRVDGALRAVFPRSVYSATENGVVAGIPPGTVFQIGAPPEGLATNYQPVLSPYDPSFDDAEPHIVNRINTQMPTPHASPSAVVGGDLRQSFVDGGWVGPLIPARVEAGTDRLAELQRSVRLNAEQDDETETQVPTIVNDASYRAQRLSELLDRAADAETARQE